MVEKFENLKEAAEKFERNHGNCAQAVCGAFLETYGFPSEEVFKSSCGLYGGVGLSGNSCGALNGSILTISFLSGREFENYNEPTPEDCSEMCKEMIDKFKGEYGSVNCEDIQEKTIGRSFDFRDEEDVEAFSESTGPDEECPKVVKKSAKWTAEILERYGYLD